MFFDFDFDIENAIKQHYKNIRKLNLAIQQIDIYRTMIDKAKESVHNSWWLSVDLKGIDYTVERVQHSDIRSPQEREIDGFSFDYHEKRLSEWNKKIYDLESTVFELKISISIFSLYLDILNEEDRHILSMRYDKHKSFRWIALELSYSETAIRSKIQKIINELSTWIGGNKNVCINGTG